MTWSTLSRTTALKARKPWNFERKPLRAKKKNALKRGGSVMSPTLREEIGLDPEYKRCGLEGLLIGQICPCAGRVTREHAMYYQGSKIQEKWAIIPCCACHHGVDMYQDGPGEVKKEIRQWVALNRATEEELTEYDRADFIQQRSYLNGKYGEYVPPPVVY